MEVEKNHAVLEDVHCWRRLDTHKHRYLWPFRTFNTKSRLLLRFFREERPRGEPYKRTLPDFFFLFGFGLIWLFNKNQDKSKWNNWVQKLFKSKSNFWIFDLIWFDLIWFFQIKLTDINRKKDKRAFCLQIFQENDFAWEWYLWLAKGFSSN